MDSEPVFSSVPPPRLPRADPEPGCPANASVLRVVTGGTAVGTTLEDMIVLAKHEQEHVDSLGGLWLVPQTWSKTLHEHWEKHAGKQMPISDVGTYVDVSSVGTET